MVSCQRGVPLGVDLAMQRSVTRAEGYNVVREDGRVTDVRFRDRVDRALGGRGAPNYRAIGKLRPVCRLLAPLIGVGVRPEHVRLPARGTPAPEPTTGR